ncbi:MAG: SoxY-related AACIE arm protein [Candidatus Competibacterales bacterium]
MTVRHIHSTSDIHSTPDVPSRGRRAFVATALATAGSLAGGVALRPAAATPPTMAAAMADVFGDAPINPGKVQLAVPAIAENGQSVPLTVAVDSPMTEADHVTAIHLFSGANPLPDVARFALGSRAGRAEVSLRIRLADSQTLTAVATLNDGSHWSGTAEVVVTLAACIDLS